MIVRLVLTFTNSTTNFYQRHVKKRKKIKNAPCKQGLYREIVNATFSHSNTNLCLSFFIPSKLIQISIFLLFLKTQPLLSFILAILPFLSYSLSLFFSLLLLNCTNTTEHKKNNQPWNNILFAFSSFDRYRHLKFWWHMYLLLLSP